MLSFFPDTSHNPQPVANWNIRVKQFADKHVQFVWITGEEQGTLMPALAQHSIKGWVLYDPRGGTAKAYGLDTPVNVYIGPDRKIVGFDRGIVPDERASNAVLDGRITHTKPTQSTLKEFMQSNLVLLDTKPFRMPRVNDHRPKFAPSYVVHITPAHSEQNGISSSDDFWVLQGVTVKEAIEKFYNVNPIRVVLPPSVDGPNRYDFAMLLPAPESHEKMTARMEQALQEYFHVNMKRERQLTDVYVVSIVPGQKPTALPANDADSLDLIRSSSIGLKETDSFEATI